MAKRKPKPTLQDLQPDPRNANKGTERGRQMLEESLSRYGAGRSILADKHGTIIAGNKTAEVAAEIGIDNIIVVESDGSKIVVVKRTDLDLDKDAHARELAYADNRVSEVDLAFDPAAILQDVQDGKVDLGALWSEKELDKLLEAANGQAEPDPPDIAWFRIECPDGVASEVKDALQELVDTFEGATMRSADDET